MSDADKGGLSNLMHEERHFDPPEELAKNANVTAEVYADPDLHETLTQAPLDDFGAVDRPESTPDTLDSGPRILPGRKARRSDRA